MRIPKKAPFVLFRLRTPPFGDIMMRAGKTAAARERFAKLVLRLHLKVTAGIPIDRYPGESEPVVVPYHSCLIYRQKGHMSYQCWPNISEEHLKELCLTFSGWMRG